MPHEIAIAVDEFLSLMRSEPSSAKSIDQLIEKLDELAWLVHRIQFEFDETEYSEPMKYNAPATYEYAKKWLQWMPQEGCDGDTNLKGPCSD